jgi:hypothetical protein
MRLEVFREWLRLLSARLFSMFQFLRIFRMKGGLLSISLQVTTILGLYLMTGFRSSRSRLVRAHSSLHNSLYLSFSQVKVF